VHSLQPQSWLAIRRLIVALPLENLSRLSLLVSTKRGNIAHPHRGVII
jgi:hypothetical protein